jgi:uncharacterized protein
MIRSSLIFLLRRYQRWISPLKPPSCRFIPTCSEYAIEAITQHGPGKGCWLAGKRICRCHPWGGHGFDPVPPKLSARLDKKTNEKKLNSHG